MLTVSKIMPQGAGLAPVLLKRASTVELDWDVRQKSRFDATDSSGRQLGIFLPRGTLVRGGDVLVADLGTARVQEATPVVIDGVMYTGGNLGRVYALNAATGEPLWTYEYECPYRVLYPEGPRTTPAVSARCRHTRPPRL